MLDFTHDPAARSWVASTAEPGMDFPLQNLPLGVVDGRCAVAIGDAWLDLPAALDAGLLAPLPPAVEAALREPRLNALLGLGRPALRAVRHAVFARLRDGDAEVARTAACLRPLAAAMAQLPCAVGDYTDFFASIHHARNTFALFRAGQTFLPNYKHLPIAYHGRSSTVGASPAGVHRPRGLLRPDPEAPPVFAPCAKLDLEVELGFWIGRGNADGAPIALSNAHEHLAGVSLLNDWSARDVQAFESQPLGPFLSKNFATTVSPWIVTMDALVPFATAQAPREPGDSAPASYLDDAGDRAHGALGIVVETWLSTPAMRRAGHAPVRISRSDVARDLWWTPGQMVAHHTVGGCVLRAGDLLGSGTLSGPVPGSAGSLLELTFGGREPLQLPGGETRRFLEDGDEVTLRGRCERPGHASLGFGTCVGRVTGLRDHSPGDLS